MSKVFELLLAIVGIYFCYLQVGFYQEKIFKFNYGTPTDPSPRFTFSFSVILFQMLITVILSRIMLYVKQQEFACKTSEGFKLGLCNFISMFGAMTALQYVSFPLQALTKSCKILSVLVVGLVIGHQTFTKQQIICGCMMTFGIMLFNLSDKAKADSQSSLFGILLLCLSLFCDGMLATLQSRYKAKKHIGQWEMSYHISLWSLCGPILQTLVQGNFYEFYAYVQHYPTIIPDLFFLTLYGVVGQLFIFYCIDKFSPRVLSIVTTSRKFFTVLFSILIHGHSLENTQSLALGIVAIGVFWELYQGQQKRLPSELHHQMPKNYEQIKAKHDEEHSNHVPKQSKEKQPKRKQSDEYKLKNEEERRFIKK